MSKSINSPTIWAKNIVARRDSSYESIDLLYRQVDASTFGDRLGFIVACSNPSASRYEHRGLLHKLEVTAVPDLHQAQIKVTHEVQPGLEVPSQIITVNERLKIAGFSRGCIIPIYNFGNGKTFNSDVRGRLSHHAGEISCLAANSTGDMISSGCTAGEIALYQVRESQISFLTRTTDTHSKMITDASFMDSQHGGSGYQVDKNTLIYSNDVGQIYLIDTRCNLADPVQGRLVFNLRPMISVSNLLPVRSKPGQKIFIGGSAGELIAIDLRVDCRVYNRESTKDKTIYKMKEVTVTEGSVQKSFLAYSNSTNIIKILDLDTMEPHEGWKCDRLPDGAVRDLVQVDERIVTCGKNVSIGCWQWNKPVVEMS